jgi:hypothetical protein
MLLSKRSYERNPPSKDAKKVYIICEGTRREPKYFAFFQELDSRIDIIIHTFSDQADNSPRGLGKMAMDNFLPQPNHRAPLVELIEGDELWIVLDTDPDKTQSRKQPIVELLQLCQEKRWKIAVSNPCFEVWLCFHFQSAIPDFALDEGCSKLKNLLNSLISGGFDCRKHPAWIETAIAHASKAYQSSENLPLEGSTQVYLLAQSIFDLVKDKLNFR